MITMTLQQVAHLLDGKLYGRNLIFDEVSIDTRRITKNCLFIALNGKRFDAHDFVEQAKEAGAVGILANRRLKTKIPQIIVNNTYLAFSKLAAWVRQQVPARVVALTGSSGKTSVKEMTAAILKQCGNTLYTEDNLNNEIGVPITLLRLNFKHDYMVIELGANHMGEIAWTVGLTRPEAALVNNLAAAHLEGFGSLKGVAKAKGEIFTGLKENGIAIINSDSNDWVNWKDIIGNRRTWRFSMKTTAGSDFLATHIRTSTKDTEFELKTPIGNVKVLLPLVGYHSIANALAASALSTAVGATLDSISIGLKMLKAIPGRLTPILLKKDKLLLDDSYNSNVSSVITAIQVLSKTPGYRVLVMGDMTELGYKSEECHEQVGEIIKTSNIDCVLSVGQFSRIISQKSNFGKHFINKTSLIAFLDILLTKKSIITVLVKGSRSTSMEEIVHVLQEKWRC